MKNDLLKRVYLHPLFTEDDLQIIFEAHEKITFGKGDLVLKQGQIANEYMIVERGLMRSFVHNFDGKDITTNFFSNNEIVIEVSSLFQRIPTDENILALTDCVCWKIDFDAFQKLFHSIEGFSEWGRAWMSKSLFDFKQRSVSMITNSATERYYKLLEEKPLVLQNAPLKHIATYLGITDTSLSRIRRDTIGQQT